MPNTALFGTDYVKAVMEETQRDMTSRLAKFQGRAQAEKTVALDPDIKALIDERAKAVIDRPDGSAFADIDQQIKTIYEAKARQSAKDADALAEYYNAALAAARPAGTSRYPQLLLGDVRPGDLIEAGYVNRLVHALLDHDYRLRDIEAHGSRSGDAETIGLAVLLRRIVGIEKTLDVLRTAIEALINKAGIKPAPGGAATGTGETGGAGGTRSGRSFRAIADLYKEEEFRPPIKIDPGDPIKALEGLFFDPPRDVLVTLGEQPNETVITIPNYDAVKNDTIESVVIGDRSFGKETIKAVTDEASGITTLVVNTVDSTGALAGTKLSPQALAETPSMQLNFRNFSMNSNFNR